MYSEMRNTLLCSMSHDSPIVIHGFDVTIMRWRFQINTCRSVLLKTQGPVPGWSPQIRL
ncbi:hypothetical protein M378DRAFT_169589 [Amanita muscaria Koide BX008]|uniref:Uncharacterized protein n=1 Tax=Amanita muscaria (strain Koide BX008) TaxID=946122 RepID=A0A0C2S8S6_AMAMK|nr:hypothetical protein M378DRAFT_169589 [Amanita muscaria Koide BX008]